MPNAIALLTADHRAVEELFGKVEGKKKPDQDAVDRIVKELSIHDAIEKQLLYPEVRSHTDHGGDVADHSEDVHDDVARILLQIDKSDNGSEEQVGSLTEVIRLVRAHVEEEESSIFPALKSSLSSTDLDKLGERLSTAKTVAPTRPHPHAPSEGLGTAVAGVMSAPLDKIKDAVQKR